MSDPRVATCLFCDDIRQETGNKFSAMGIYGADMIIPLAGPVLIPKIGIVLSLIVDVGDEPETLTATVLIPSEKRELLRVETKRPDVFDEVGKDVKKRIIRMVLPCPSFEVAENSEVEVIVDTGQEQIRAGRLLIKLTAPPVEATEAPTQQ
jgi:hypothetical protein